MDDFRVMENGTYVYAQSRTNFFFNSTRHFGENVQGSVLSGLSSVGKGHPRMYSDMNYNRVALFKGPYEIAVLPFLHSNRITLVGVNHEISPIVYQLRG